MSAAMPFVAALIGVALASIAYVLRFARPWRFASVASGEAERVAQAARRVVAGGRATSSDFVDAEALYERWINLPRDACSAAAEDLRRDGIDMIRLGDTLRRRRRSE